MSENFRRCLAPERKKKIFTVSSANTKAIAHCRKTHTLWVRACAVVNFCEENEQKCSFFTPEKSVNGNVIIFAQTHATRSGQKGKRRVVCMRVCVSHLKNRSQPAALVWWKVSIFSDWIGIDFASSRFDSFSACYCC